MYDTVTITYIKVIFQSNSMGYAVVLNVLRLQLSLFKSQMLLIGPMPHCHYFPGGRLTSIISINDFTREALSKDRRVKAEVLSLSITSPSSNPIRTFVVDFPSKFRQVSLLKRTNTSDLLSQPSITLIPLLFCQRLAAEQEMGFVCPVLY